MLPSNHFTKYELVYSATANKYSITNSPTRVIWLALDLVVNKCAEPIRNKWRRLKVSSGYRCSELNYLTGGAKHSQHIKGEALDLIPLDALRDEVFEWIRTSDIVFDQLITYDSKPHFHISYVEHRKNRMEVLRCDKYGVYHVI